MAMGDVTRILGRDELEECDSQSEAEDCYSY